MALDGLLPRYGRPPALQDEIVLHRVLWDRPVALWPLYWRSRRNGAEDAGAVRLDRSGDLRIEPGATAAFNTYFGAVFERPWRLHTRAGAFTLSFAQEGAATVRVFRRFPGGARVLLHEEELGGPARIELSPEALHHRQVGLLWFEVTAGSGGAVLQRAEWGVTEAGSPPTAQLAVVICTFNRQAPLGAVLSALAEDRGLDEAVARVIVVNQGAPGLSAHPAVAPAAAALGTRLRVIEQANLGGAGGFGRGMLEALDDSTTTHICLLDDDVRVEPESLRRMAAFFTLAAGEPPVALGGHMLDGLQETVLYEAGAVVRPNWTLQPLNHDQDLRAPERLLRLIDTQPMHYNGWWMFGFDKRLIDRVGMPLPCFIRGDDVEFGLRLHQEGVPTVSLPGVAIWHEPFYLKIGGWQLYYETRNAMIAAALHEAFPPRQAAVLMLKRLLIHLLTYRYYNAALIIRAVRDFREGPAILDRDPRPLHAGLAALRTQWPDATTRREQVLPKATVAQSPRFRLGFAWALLAAVWLNWARPTRAEAGARRLLAKDLVWFRVVREGVLAVDTYWDRDLPTYRRDRAAFRALLREGLGEVWRLWRAPGLRTAWQGGAPKLKSVEFWRHYTGAKP